MRVEGWLFLGCGIFIAGADVVYWYTSYDPTGTTALALAVGLCLLTGFYIMFTGRRLPMRPEVDTEAEGSDGTGEIGFFSPTRWGPLFGGRAGAFPAPGFAIGWWMVLIGFVALFLTTIGFVFEYYRGRFAH